MDEMGSKEQVRFLEEKKENAKYKQKNQSGDNPHHDAQPGARKHRNAGNPLSNDHTKRVHPRTGKTDLRGNIGHQDGGNTVIAQPDH